MSDLIERQTALDAIQQRADRVDSVYSAFWEGLIIAQDIVKNIPSAEPERKRGKWVYKPNEYDDNTYECSQCGEPWTLIDGTPEENNMKFCPNCGAELRGE